MQKLECPACKKSAASRRDRTEYSKKRWADPVVRERCRAYLKKYRAENREKLNAQRKEYLARNPGLFAQWQREWRKRNPGYHATEVRAWNKAHREIRIAQWQKRRALELSAPGSFTAADWIAIKAKQDGRCFDCGEERKLTVGHLVPLSRGGSNNPSNIVGQCVPCNSRQHNKIHPSVRMVA